MKTVIQRKGTVIFTSERMSITFVGAMHLGPQLTIANGISLPTNFA
jgi:hypothetical protein